MVATAVVGVVTVLVFMWRTVLAVRYLFCSLMIRGDVQYNIIHSNADMISLYYDITKLVVVS